MYITDILLNGFRVFGSKTGLDPQLNAITGTKGKSTILYLICFDLGLTDYGIFGAEYSEQLVFGNGRLVGIEGWAVKIVFDNSNESKSPVAYKNSPKISIEPKVMYLNQFVCRLM